MPLRRARAVLHEELFKVPNIPFKVQKCLKLAILKLSFNSSIVFEQKFLASFEAFFFIFDL
jgi:hypothetical protein